MGPVGRIWILPLERGHFCPLQRRNRDHPPKKPPIPAWLWTLDSGLWTWDRGLWTSDLPMPETTLILNAQAMQRALARIAHEIAERNEVSNEVALVGIQRGGVPLAKRLGVLLGAIWTDSVPLGSLDVSMHRDDLDQRIAPNMQPTVIPFNVNGRT